MDFQQALFQMVSSPFIGAWYKVKPWVRLGISFWFCDNLSFLSLLDVIQIICGGLPTSSISMVSSPFYNTKVESKVMGSCPIGCM